MKTQKKQKIKKKGKRKIYIQESKRKAEEITSSVPGDKTVNI